LKRLLPQPVLTLVLFTVWLLLANRVSAGEVLLGGLFGLLIPHLTRSFWPGVQLRRPLLLAGFLAVVLRDIVVANLQVAILVLGPKRRLHPAFLSLPLDLENELAVTVLASTISLTPGTVTADVDPDRRTLLIHCLDVGDPEALIRRIKTRYEAPLKEILP